MFFSRIFPEFWLFSVVVSLIKFRLPFCQIYIYIYIYDMGLNYT